MVKQFAEMEVWFVTGSQDLYGPEVLREVERNATHMVQGLNESGLLPVRLMPKAVVTTPEAISAVCREANASAGCIGLVFWMHTFSPAKMWIAGLNSLSKPYAHLHTQFNRDIPWSTIDMNFMNLNQAAHGDREFGFICTRLRQSRKVIVGHWETPRVREQLASWMRVAAAWCDAQTMKVARLGDNMRHVAVTEGDKIEAQIRLGYAVNGYGIGDLVQHVQAASDAEVERLCGEYDQTYEMAPALRSGGPRRADLAVAARIELGLRAFLEEGRFKAFTDTFEDLDGLCQLPGIAVQRLMADGYGFGAEGDWKQAALVRSLKVMGDGLKGGATFMEDYTYHLSPSGALVLGAHMLEICPSIAAGKPSCEIHPLGIGGKEDPVRLVFTARPGPAINATVIDLGDRFRMVVNAIKVVTPEQDLPKLPVARAVWRPLPDLETAAASWILAGGAHHMGFSSVVTAEQMEDFAEMAGMECLVIDQRSAVRDIQREMRWNQAYYRLAGGL
ncbi:MAG: L-arabinose isomerase [Thermoguttaceae bacterium]